MSKVKFKVTVTIEKTFELDRELYESDWTDEQILDFEREYAEEGAFVEWTDAKVSAKAEMIEEETNHD